MLILLPIQSAVAGEPTHTKYQYLLNHLSEQGSVQNFIKNNNYLSDRLHKKWLAYLAKHTKLQLYKDNYSKTSNIKRRCFYLHALYATGEQTEVLQKVKPIWLSGHKRPEACQFIFTKWQASEEFNDS